MKKTYIKRLGETVLEETLENGLKIIVIPKPKFSKTAAIFATRYGSVDSEFMFKGDAGLTKVPDGIAHFLEHKLFDNPEGDNTLALFSQNGASPNAYTSFSKTAYFFECTDLFYKNLELLLHFVSTPYFTEESVEKERGIIAQEIRMGEDNPIWEGYTGLLALLYDTHPVRKKIAGTVESISEITHSLLYRCYEVFYNPKNMVLCVCGNADFDAVVKMARKILPKEQSGREIERGYKAETAPTQNKYGETKMAVSEPTFFIGFKDDEAAFMKSPQNREIETNIAGTLLFGKSSPLFSEIYNSGLISGNLECEYNFETTFGFSMLLSRSKDCKKVLDAILSECDKKAKEGFDREYFECVKNAVISSKIRDFDSPFDVSNMAMEAYFTGDSLDSLTGIFDGITYESVMERIRSHFTRERCAMYVVNPLK